jgi:hypothetical protein
MLVGVDIDGTVDADPPVFLSLLQALRAAGHRVVILTGSSADTASTEDLEQKKQYLQSLGLGEAYDQIVVFGDPTSQLKAEWVEANGCDLLIDNDRGNAQAACGECLVLLPWASRVGNKNAG